MQQTEKYQFNLIDPGDDFGPEKLNENMEAVEAALGAKAEQTALEALAKQVTALEQGQLRYKYGSYEGDGKAGSKYPSRLEFDFKPLMLLIVHPTEENHCCFPWLRGMSRSRSSLGTTNYMRITWEDKAVQWYAPYSNPSGDTQMNGEDTTYWYLALGISE